MSSCDSTSPATLKPQLKDIFRRGDSRTACPRDNPERDRQFARDRRQPSLHRNAANLTMSSADANPLNEVVDAGANVGAADLLVDELPHESRTSRAVSSHRRARRLRYKSAPVSLGVVERRALFVGIKLAAPDRRNVDKPNGDAALDGYPRLFERVGNRLLSVRQARSNRNGGVSRRLVSARMRIFCCPPVSV